MDMVFIIAVVAFIVLLTCMCCRSKRAKPMFSAPVIVTTTEYAHAQPGGGAHIVNTVPHMTSAHAMAHPGGSGMVQHTTQYQAAAPYPIAPMHHHYQGPAPPGGVAPYPMPLPGGQPTGYPSAAVGVQPPYPMRGPHDNPPSYDQVASNDVYQKQQPYNPNYQP